MKIFYVVATMNSQFILLLLHRWNYFTVRNRNTNIWYAGCIVILTNLTFLGFRQSLKKIHSTPKGVATHRLRTAVLEFVPSVSVCLLMFFCQMLFFSQSWLRKDVRWRFEVVTYFLTHRSNYMCLFEKNMFRKYLRQYLQK